MTEWWEALTSLGRVFACVAIPATLVLVIQTVLSVIGLCGDGDADVNVNDSVDLDGDGIPDVPEMHDGVFGGDVNDVNDGIDSGFRLLSLRSIVAFLTIFGWVGLIAVKHGLPNGWSIIVSFLCGLAAMTAVAAAIWFMMRLQSDGTRNIRNALGKSGSVYLFIPPAREGTGKVNLLLQDTYVELNAVTDEENLIPSGREVVVIGISGQNTLVVKSK